jgi:hypothetical protein
MVFGILILVLVLLVIGFGAQFAVPYPDAVVQGRTLAMSQNVRERYFRNVPLPAGAVAGSARCPVLVVTT